MKRRIYANSAEQHPDFANLMNMYCFYTETHDDGYVNEFKDTISGISTVIHVYDEDSCYDVVVTDTTPEGLVSCKEESFEDIYQLIDYLDVLAAKYNLKPWIASTICRTDDRQQVVLAAISTRDLSKNMVRVKSSNVWSYSINLKDRKAKTGDVLCQFKGKNGGPGDIYMYYDVPVNLWRKWLSAPSKGHFFWQYIRNNFYYRKLTGNKRGVLKNAIN